MPIDAAEVRRIAALARLRLDERTAETLRHQLQSILDYVARLEGVDTSGVPPTASTLDRSPRLRADRPAPCLGAGRATDGAPDAAEGLFRVPRVIDG